MTAPRTLAAAVLAVISCGPSARLREGDSFLKENKFDLALLSYQQAYQASPNNERARAALGRMLTMRRISFHAGLDLMKSAYDARPNAELRRELLLLHLDAGDIKRAEDLVHPDRMSTEEYRTAEAALERAAVQCVRKQNEEGFYGLKTRPDDAPGLKQAFLVRCLLSPGWRRTKVEDARAVFNEIGPLETRCELTAVFPEASSLSADYCKSSFPGVIAIHRETIRGIEAASVHTQKLFDSDLFIPGEPPPQPKDPEEEKMTPAQP